MNDSVVPTRISAPTLIPWLGTERNYNTEFSLYKILYTNHKSLPPDDIRPTSIVNILETQPMGIWNSGCKDNITKSQLVIQNSK